MAGTAVMAGHTTLALIASTIIKSRWEGRSGDRNNILKYVQDNPLDLKTKEKKEYIKESNVTLDDTNIFE